MSDATGKPTKYVVTDPLAPQDELLVEGACIHLPNGRVYEVLAPVRAFDGPFWKDVEHEALFVGWEIGGQEQTTTEREEHDGS